MQVLRLKTLPRTSMERECLCIQRHVMLAKQSYHKEPIAEFSGARLQRRHWVNSAAKIKVSRLLTRSIFKRYSTPQSLHPEICANSLPPSSLGTLRPSRVVQPLVQKPATSSKIGPYKVATFALRPCPCSMTAHGTASATNALPWLLFPHNFSTLEF